MIIISGKSEAPKLETAETKIRRRLSNMGFAEEQKDIIVQTALKHPDQKYMLRCSKETYYEMLPNKN